VSKTHTLLDLAHLGEEPVAEEPVETRALDDEDAWQELHDSMDTALSERLTVAFLGSASAGKDSAIKALFGVDFGQIDPVPGSTDEIRVAKLDLDGRFLLVNAPGFQDVRGSVDAKARQILDQVDVAIYLVNAEGGATAAIKQDLAAVRRRGHNERPTLVAINKIDLIRRNQREEFVTRTLEQLGADPEHAIATSFDPHPRLGIDPIGLDQVVEWIDGQLREQGKELLFAKYLFNKRLACAPIIKQASRRAAMAGAVPIPGADITAVTWIQVRMVEQITAVYGKKLDRDIILWMVGELLAGGSKGLVRKGVSALKTAGFIPGAQVAQAATAAIAGGISAAATHGIGQASMHYLESDSPPTLDELKVVFNQVAQPNLVAS
jgi:GTP-binding protein Era